MRGAFNHFISGFLILVLLTGSYLTPVNGSQNSLPPEANQIIFALFESLNTGDEYEDLRRIAAIKANKNQTTFHALLLRASFELTKGDITKVSIPVIFDCVKAATEIGNDQTVEFFVNLFGMMTNSLSKHPEYNKTLVPLFREAPLIVAEKKKPLPVTGTEDVDWLNENEIPTGDEELAEEIEVISLSSLKGTSEEASTNSRESEPSASSRQNESRSSVNASRLSSAIGENLRSGGTPRLALPPPSEESMFAHEMARLQKLREELEATVIGQPEVVDAFMKAEFRRVISGHDGKAGLLMLLMGLPGTGKDTSVTAWINAIHGRPDAHVSHMMTIHPVKTKADIQKHIGSPPGYVSSDDIPKLVEFLVRHSGGKYMIIDPAAIEPQVTKTIQIEKQVLVQNEQGELESGTLYKTIKGASQGSGGKNAASKSKIVVLNKNWKPGMVLPGYFAPSEGIVFLNELHNFSQLGTDALKTFIEEGRLPLANPGSSVGEYEALNEIVVPIRRIGASNNAISSISNLRLDGTRIGSPLSFEEMFRRWELIYWDKARLKQSIIEEGNEKGGSGAGAEDIHGMSTETINRFPNRNLLLLRPLSPEDLRKVVRIKLSQMNAVYANSKVGFSKLKFSYTDELVDFLQEWQFVADEGGRAIQDRVDGLIEDSINQAIANGSIAPGEKSELVLGVRRNEKGSYNLTVSNKNSGSQFEIQISGTELAEYEEEPTEEEIRLAYEIGERMSRRVFGLDKEAKMIGNAIARRLINSRKHLTVENAEREALSFMFLGLSSTGKTEMAKAIAAETFKSEERIMIVPFGDIKTVAALEEYFFGRKEGRRTIKSKVAERWDMWGGKFVLVLDEISNAPEEVQTAMYDMLREKVFRGFVDGKDRFTEDLIVVMTGNAGEKEYNQIPREDIPEIEQQAALYEIHRQINEDPSYRRAILERHFKAAFLNRVGERNIILFPPISYQTIRKVVQMKLLNGVKRIKRQKVGYDISFVDEESFEDIVKVIEVEGFVLFEQGASLARFADTFLDQVYDALAANGTKPGSKATIYIKNISNQKIEGTRTIPGQVTIGIALENGQELELNIDRRIETENHKSLVGDKITTAAHEGGGHELVRSVLQRLAPGFENPNDYDLGITQPNFITIVPGLTRIGGNWLRYLGLASHQELYRPEMTKNHLINQMAVLAAGEVAETLIQMGDQSNAGKSNDMERANRLATFGILCWGLSSQWKSKYGNLLCPTGQDPFDWISKTFTEKMKEDFQKIMTQWHNEARDLARNTMLANWNLFIELSTELAVKGTMDRNQIEAVYAKHELVRPGSWKATFNSMQLSVSKTFARVGSMLPGSRDRYTTRFNPGFPVPENVADIEKLLIEEKNLQLSEVDIPDDIPVLGQSDLVYQRLVARQKATVPPKYRYTCQSALRSR